MQYTQHLIDRRSGDFVSVDMGEWITVTELGERYGVGRNKVRAVLHRMGLLQSEGKWRRLRLTPEAVAQGLGKRHDKPKNGKYPFDVISPAGQAFIADNWREATSRLEADTREDPKMNEAKDALTAYALHRSFHRLSEMTPQMRVCWLIERFPMLTFEQVAAVVGVTHQLVSRYAETRRKQLDYLTRRKAANGALEPPPAGLIAYAQLDHAGSA